MPSNVGCLGETAGRPGGRDASARRNRGSASFRLSGIAAVADQVPLVVPDSELNIGPNPAPKISLKIMINI